MRHSILFFEPKTSKLKEKILEKYVKKKIIINQIIKMKKKKRNILLTAQIFKILKGPLVIQRALVLKVFFLTFFWFFSK